MVLSLGVAARWVMFALLVVMVPCQCFTFHSPSVTSYLDDIRQSALCTHRRQPDKFDMKKSFVSILQQATFTLAIAGCTLLSPLPSLAAPPFAVIAEELGYFPVMVPKPGSTTQERIVQYVPKRVQRQSTDQAVDLAHFLRTRRDTKVILAGTYWCSHTSRQKELFGLEAWAELNANAGSTSTSSTTLSRPSGFTYLECAPQGYRSNPTICSNLGVDGYPTWIIRKSSQKAVRLSGERSLNDIAEAVGYNQDGRTFDSTLEAAANPPPSFGSAACKN